MKNLFIAFLLLPAVSFCQNATTTENTTLTENKPVAEKSINDLRNERKGLPVYLFNGTGSGSIIGFMNFGTFRKVRPAEYQELVVQKFAQDLLENEDQFKAWLRIQYGSYCVAIN